MIGEDDENLMKGLEMAASACGKNVFMGIVVGKDGEQMRFYHPSSIVSEKRDAEALLTAMLDAFVDKASITKLEEFVAGYCQVKRGEESP